MAAAGRVRCGSCLHVFAARDGFDPDTDSDSDTQPDPDGVSDDARAGMPADSAAEMPDAPVEVVAEDDGLPEPGSFDPARLPQLSTAVHDDLPIHSGSRHRPVLETSGPPPVDEAARRRLGGLQEDIDAPATPGNGVVMVGLALLLCATLALQWLWWQRNQLALDPHWRAWYEPVCAVLGCELPPRRDVALIHSLRLVVRPQEGRQDRLLIDALIVNDAPFAQPFPVLELQLSQVNDRPLAARRFRPSEYLSGELAGATVMPPRTPVRITLVVVRPGDFGSYRIDFR